MTDPLHALPAGHELGEYRIERVLGASGFGITCYAWDIHLDKPIAVREYLPNEFALCTDTTTVKPKSTSDEARALRADFYFAYSYNSRERGTNENTNGLIRPCFPKGCDFATIAPSQLARAVHQLNHRPKNVLA